MTGPAGEVDQPRRLTGALRAVLGVAYVAMVVAGVGDLWAGLRGTAVLSSISTGMSVFQQDLSTGPLATRLGENVPAGPYEMPLLIAQGGADSLIVPSVQAAFAERLCTSGNAVDYRTYPGRDHVPLVEPDSELIPDLVAWTRERFASEPFAGNCQ